MYVLPIRLKHIFRLPMLRVLAAVLLMGLALVDHALAQAGSESRWPTDKVVLIVPAVPGSSGDTIARILASKLSVIWNQAVVVENRPGAGGIIGMRQTAAAAPDGYTLVLTATTTAVVMPYVYRSARYDVGKDLVPVALVGYTPMAIVASADSPVKNISDLINASRQNPDKLTLGHPGIATMAHLSAELLNQEAGAKLFDVNMGGATNGLKGVISGDINYYIDGLGAVMPMVRSHQVQVVTVFSDKIPDELKAASLAKDSVPGMVIQGWFAILAPAGTPKSVVEKINKEVNAVITMPDVVSRLRDFATYPQGGSVEAVAAYVQSEKERWGNVLKRANLQPQ